MTLKQRLAVYLSMAFAALLGLALLFIYFSFSTFRSQEFAARLREEALSDITLLKNTQIVDKQLLRTIDNNSVHKLYNEKTLIFDADQRLIYSSVPDALVRYNPKDLTALKSSPSFFRENDGYELFGLRYQAEQTFYYVLISSQDIYGLSKIQYLAYTLLLVFLVGCFLVGGVAYLIVMRLVRPLDALQQKIEEISIRELNTQLPETQRKDEINALSKSFNQMLRRIENAYTAQKEFTANASHELRTPISRLTMQLDNLLLQPQTELVGHYLQNMSTDVGQMADLVQSLLVLSKVSNTKKEFKTERIDDIIFDAYKIVRKQFNDFQMSFEIVESQGFEPDLAIKGNRSLLEIVFVNLFKNACQYSDAHRISVKIEQVAERNPLKILFTNTGAPIDSAQADKLFEAFVRGSNAQNIAGSGLGLRIVKRILDFHHASVSYMFVSPNIHQFVVIL